MSQTDGWLSGTKSAFASKGVWGGIVAFVSGLSAAVAPMLGLAEGASVLQVVLALISASGGLGAILGRLVATKRISH